MYAKDQDEISIKQMSRREMVMKDDTGLGVLIIEQLKTVYDPEMPSINVYDLGLIYDICICDRTDGHPVKDVDVTHTLTSMFCPMADEISNNIKQAVERVAGVGVVTIKLTHTPPFSREMMSEEAILTLGF
jgi:metal-sulfur cluster biosynthetic enzyme